MPEKEARKKDPLLIIFLVLAAVGVVAFLALMVHNWLRGNDYFIPWTPMWTYALVAWLVWMIFAFCAFFRWLFRPKYEDLV
jgi:hypothetical protein